MKKLIALVSLAISFNATASGWRYIERVDPITDIETKMLAKEESNPENEFLKHRLFAGCIGEYSVLTVEIPFFLTLKDEMKLTYRFDKGEVRTETCSVFDKGLLCSNQDTTREMHKKLLSSKYVHFRIELNKSSEQFSVDLEGFQGALSRRPMPCLASKKS